MSAPDTSQPSTPPAHEPDLQRQIAFAAGLFEGDSTIRTLLESLAEGVVIIDDSRTIVLVNRRAELIFGYPPRELVGKPHGVLIPDRFQHMHDAQMDEYFADPRIRPMGYLLDLVGRRLDGSEVPLEISLSFVETGNGVFVISFVSDITQRKLAEQEIQRLNADLAERAAELEAANRELETFNYTVAHDLRKPLAVVNGYCQAIRELCGDELGDACREYLQVAYDATLRMNGLIEALLNFSRLARVELRHETVDLSLLAQTVAAELRLVEPHRRVTVRIAEGMQAEGDVNLLRVVLDNLLGNAWKYTSERDEGDIEFGVAQQDGVPVFFVRDNGPGFAAEDAEKLFLPFARLAGAEAFRGFGIGLATVERIIRRHGGRIWAEGEPGRGATFWFTLQT